MRIADLDTAIRLAPTDASAYNSRAWTYQLAGRDADALTDANRAIELNPNDANSYDTRGTIHAKLGQRDKAIADFRKALELSPGDGEQRRGAEEARGAVARMSLGRARRAPRATCGSAIRMSPSAGKDATRLPGTTILPAPARRRAVALDRVDDLAVLAVLALHVHGDDAVDRRHQEQHRRKNRMPKMRQKTISTTLKIAENGCPLSSRPSGGSRAARM